MKIHTVVFTDKTQGRSDDPTRIFRTRDMKEAERFAVSQTHFSEPATVQTDDVPLRIAQRWGF